MRFVGRIDASKLQKTKASPYNWPSKAGRRQALRSGDGGKAMPRAPDPLPAMRVSVRKGPARANLTAAIPAALPLPFQDPAGLNLTLVERLPRAGGAKAPRAGRTARKAATGNRPARQPA